MALTLEPSGRRWAAFCERPAESEFRRVVEEFWLEAYHVAKYLARDELWLAKERDWATKRFLATMIGSPEILSRRELGRRLGNAEAVSAACK